MSCLLSDIMILYSIILSEACAIESLSYGRNSGIAHLPTVMDSPAWQSFW